MPGPLTQLNQAVARSVITVMKRYSLAAGAAAALSILVAACGSSADTATKFGAATPTASAVAPRSGGIVISGFAFSGNMTVKPGQKVTVANQDSPVHTLTDKTTNLFDTGNIAGSGGTGTFTAPRKPGSYPFVCRYHPFMQGTLIVSG